MRRSLHIGPWTVEPDLNSISRDGETARLEPKAMEVLLRLAKSPGETVPKDEILQSVWPGTFVSDDVLSRAVYELRKAFHDDPREPQVIRTVSKRGYRLVAHIEEEADSASLLHLQPVRPNRHILLAACGTLALVIVAAVAFFWLRPNPGLTARDSILVADFANSTGDPIFDGTLKEALTIKLRESPFLHVVPDELVRESLRYMELPADEPVTPTLAREICQRRGIPAIIEGSIASTGTRYVIMLKAVKCKSWESLGSELEEAHNKDAVLHQLGTAASRLRHQLGESHSSLARFDAPMEGGTTRSLEALQMVQAGVKVWEKTSDNRAVMPFFKRAVELDPKFARIYVSLSRFNQTNNRLDEAADYAKRAYELRDGVSELERMQITTQYNTIVTGDYYKAIESSEFERRIYPREGQGSEILGHLYARIGQFDKSLQAHEEANRIAQEQGLTIPLLITNVASAYLNANRIGDARRLIEQSPASVRETWPAQLLLFNAAFVEGDATEMRRHEELWARARPEFWAFSNMNIAAFHGKSKEMRVWRQRAFQAAAEQQNTITVKSMAADAALVEAYLGNRREARTLAAMATGSPPSDTAGLAFALSGDTAGAQRIAEALDKRWPSHTIIQGQSIPTIRAAIELERKKPQVAIELLRRAEPYDLVGLDSIYVRGLAYLQAGSGKQAAAEFQKLLDNRGKAPLATTHALAHLGLARSYAIQGDRVQAKRKYEEFLTLWKDADPDAVLLREAKREYAKLAEH